MSQVYMKDKPETETFAYAYVEDDTGALKRIKLLRLKELVSFSLDEATAETLGGVKAEAKIETDTVVVRIGEDGKLYVPCYPTTLKNPNALTINIGASQYIYDGSGAVTISIENGNNDIGIARIEKLNTDTSVELQPNALYVFPEMTELSLTFAEPEDASIVNEYHCIFRSGATATTLTIPDTINLPSGFTVEANKVYEISVMESCLTYQSWAVS